MVPYVAVNWPYGFFSCVKCKGGRRVELWDSEDQKLNYLTEMPRGKVTFNDVAGVERS